MTDEAGLKSDALEVVLADHDPAARIELPATGAELELWLGYDGQAQRMGLFIVDELELSGPPDQLKIRAKASPQDQSTGGKTSLQTQKTRSWEHGTILADMVRTVAQEHGMEAAVADTLASIALPHVDQVNESDINLLTRVVKDYDAIAKPAGGKLILAKRGESKTTSGQQLDTITVTPEQVTTWRVTISKRQPSGTVVAVWRDLATAQDKEAKVGSGEPVKRLRHQHTDQASAEKAARTEYQKGQRSERQLSVTMPGDPSLIAEARLVLDQFREGAAGEWLITRVDHSLDSGGYRCSITGETPPE
jgi:phage protein D